MKLIEELVKCGLNVRLLDDSDIIELQAFIELSDDFFILCEGEKGSAERVLTDCPSSKNPSQDKFVLGVYDNKKLICIIDLIQNYPDEGIWTIGYLLIHPDYRSQGKGLAVVESLAEALRKIPSAKMRCSVQIQNPRVLNFWIKCGFNVVKTIEETLGSLKNSTYVLERQL